MAVDYREAFENSPVGHGRRDGSHRRGRIEHDTIR